MGAGSDGIGEAGDPKAAGAQRTAGAEPDRESTLATLSAPGRGAAMAAEGVTQPS
jgi:hypothetical protein